MGGGFTVLYLLLVVFVVVLAICWIILPFAVIGTKPLLERALRVMEDLLKEARETNKLLRAVQDGTPRPPAEAAQPVPPRKPHDALAPELPPPPRY